MFETPSYARSPTPVLPEQVVSGPLLNYFKTLRIVRPILLPP